VSGNTVDAMDVGVGSEAREASARVSSAHGRLANGSEYIRRFIPLSHGRQFSVYRICSRTGLQESLSQSLQRVPGLKFH
jgi:hypothetical protein